MRVPVRLAAALLGLTAVCSCIPMGGLPGRPQVIATADYAVDAAGEQAQCDVTAGFSIFCHAADQVVPLLPRDTALLDWQADGGRVVAQGDTYVFVAREPGDYRLTVKFLARRLSPTPGTSRIELPSVPANRVAVRLRLPGDSGRLITSPEGIVTSDAVAEGVRTVSLLAPLTPAFALQWDRAVVAEAAGSAFSAHNKALVQVRPGLASRREVITCTVQRGLIERLSLAIPEGVAVRSIAGSNVLSWAVAGDGRTADVRLAARVLDKMVLVVQSEELLPPLPTAFVHVPVAVAGAAVQEGQVRFLAAEAMVLEQDAVTGATRRMNQGDAVAALSYDYSRLPVDIRLRGSLRQPRVTVAVQSLAVIEAGVVTLHSDMEYQVQGRPIRGVVIGLPDGAAVLDVAGDAVRDWDVGDDRQLRVRFDNSRLGPTRLSVRTHQDVRKINGLVIPRLQPADVVSQEGVVGVSAGEGVQLRHHHATLTEQIDISELPEWVRRGGARLAYRYRQGGGTLAVETEQIRARVTADMNDLVILEQDALTRATTIHLAVADDQIFDLVLLVPSSLTPLRVTGPRVAAWRLTPATGQDKAALSVTLTDGLTGTTSLIVETTQAVDYTRPLRIESIDVPVALRTRGQVALTPGSDLKLSVVEVRSLRESTEAAIRSFRRQSPALPGAGAGDAASRALHYDFTEPWAGVFHVEPLVPLVAVAAETLLRVGQGDISAETQLICTIQEAGVSSLRVKLPSWAVNSWIEGEDISGRRLDADSNTWTIALATRRKGQYRLRVTYDRLVDREATDVTHEEPRVLEAAGHKGVLHVGKQSDQVDVTVAPSGHARTVERGAEAMSADVPVVRTIEYSGLSPQDWGLSLRLAQLGEADVLKLQASDCLLQTMINRDGTAMTFMTLTVQSTRQQFAPIELPDRRQLWAAYVDGRPVKPVEGDRPGAYRIPLLQRERRDGAFELTVVYAEQLPPLEGRAVDMNFQTPPVEVATGSMGWEVFMPQGYALRPDLVGDEGNMRMVIRPPDADVPVSRQMLGPDSRRWEQVWPSVQPVADVVLTVLAVVAATAVAAAAVWLMVRRGGRLLRRAVSPPARAARYVWKRPGLRWAALMMLAAIPVMLILAALLMPALGVKSPPMMGRVEYSEVSVDAAEGGWTGVWARRDLEVVGAALEAYRSTFDVYPADLAELEREKLVESGVVERLKKSGTNYFGESLNMALRQPQGRAGEQKDVTGVLLADVGADGYTVVRPGNEVQHVEPGQRRQLARELYRQGEVNNPIVEEDLKPTEEDLRTYSESYEKAKMLGGKSRARQDSNLLNLEAQRRMKLAEKFYGWDEADRDSGRASRSLRGEDLPLAPEGAQPGAAEEPRDDITRADEKKDLDKAFKGQAADVLRQAQEAAGVTKTEVQTTPQSSFVFKLEAGTKTGSGVGYGAATDVPAAAAGGVATAKPDQPGPESEARGIEGVPHGKANGPSAAAADEGWRPWDAGGVEAVSLSPVREGRTRGSLPIGLQLPQGDRLPYMFSRVGRGFSGGDMGHFRIEAVRSGSGYAVYAVAAVAVAGLVGTAAVGAARRLRRGRAAAR
ncbi:MAG: hypothetical protein GXY74_04800 [Phycisphaerae bacterium]|nr:hypothetical protein [Phycisphaerae bacterium]